MATINRAQAIYSPSAFSMSSSSTVPGPGMLAGRMAKAVGDAAINFLVDTIIRIRLRSIQQTLDKRPYIFLNPVGTDEQKVHEIYTKLKELCRYSAREYYAESTQRRAANLISDIATIMLDSSESRSHDERWQGLLAEVLRRNDAEHLFRVNAIGPFTHEQREYPLFRRLTVNIKQIGRRHTVSNMWRAFPVVPHSPSSTTWRREPTIMILGIHGVGKSAISKTFKTNWDTEELTTYRSDVIKTTIASMQAILIEKGHSSDRDANVDLENELADTSAAANSIASLSLDTNLVDTEEGLRRIRDAINFLWQHPAIRHAYHLYKETQRAKNYGDYAFKTAQPDLGRYAAIEIADYLFNSADRIFTEHYVPTRDDILRLQSYTMGIQEEIRSAEGFTWRVAEASELCLSNFAAIAPDVTVCIFVVALTDFCKYKDKQNLLEKSFELYKDIIADPLLRSKIIVLFNKVDAFKEILEKVPMQEHLLNYKGNTFDKACDYLRKGFLKPARALKKPVTVKFVSAFDNETTNDTLQAILSEIRPR